MIDDDNGQPQANARGVLLEHCFGSPYRPCTTLLYTDHRRRLARISIEAKTLKAAIAKAQRIVAEAKADGTIWHASGGRVRPSYANPPEVIDQLANENYPLAWKAAALFLGGGERRSYLMRFGDVGDYNGQAFLALRAAARNYKPHLGNQFSTFAVVSIKGSLSTWVTRQVHKCAVGIPVYEDGRRGFSVKPNHVMPFGAIDGQRDDVAAREQDHADRLEREELMAEAKRAAERLNYEEGSWTGRIVQAALELRTADLATLYEACRNQTTQHRRTFATLLKQGLRHLSREIDEQRKYRAECLRIMNERRTA